MTATEIKTNLQDICRSFSLGDLKGWRTEENELKEYKTAKFRTDQGEFKYIFRNSKN